MKKFLENDNNSDTIDQADNTARIDFDPRVPSRETILELLRSQKKALSLEAIADATNASIPLSEGFIRRIKAMERDGQIKFNSQGRLLLVKNTNYITGTVQGHRDGFGFLIPTDGSDDLFLSHHEMVKVLHGDKVKVTVKGTHRGRPEAAIVEVLERRTIKLVGRLIKENNTFIVVPEDQRIKHDILIPAQDLGQAKAGQVVTVQILRQPASHIQPTGKIIEILGEVDDPGVEIEIAVRKFNVPVDFSADTINQLKKVPAKVQARELKDRVDLRDIPFITIDGEDARDFDDAVFCMAADLGTAKRSRPGWRLLVAIADVSHYVKQGSALDADALERGTSVYFPRRVIPMLPEALSNGICSLNPDVDRLVMVCDMLIPAGGAKAGQVSAYQFYEAVIHSHARTTYTDIWSALQQADGPAAQKLGDIYPNVEKAYELYQSLFAARRKRGAIEFDTVETKVICNDLGRIERIEPAVRNDAHRLIEEFMLAANTCAADFIKRNKKDTLFRVHEGPTPEKLQQLRDFLRQIGLQLGGGEEPKTADYARLILESRARPDFATIQSLCLRSMQQAIYSPEQSGHFGLAYDNYAHFTSPIRRYPDLLVHRVIRNILKNTKYKPPLIEDVPQELLDELYKNQDDKRKLKAAAEKEAWNVLGAVLSARERRADDASRDVLAWLKCWFIKEHMGEIFAGHISSITSFGLFVTLDALYVDGLVHISELGSDYYQYIESLNELRGERTGLRYKIGDSLQVQVSRVDLEARRIDFRLLKNQSIKSLIEQNDEPPKQHKKAAGPKPKALRGSTASQRRAQAKKNARTKSTKKGK